MPVIITTNESRIWGEELEQLNLIHKKIVNGESIKSVLAEINTLYKQDVLHYKHLHAGIYPDSLNVFLAAAKYGNLIALKESIAAGINSSDMSSKGLSALHYAAMNNDVAMLSYLIDELKFDPNLLSKKCDLTSPEPAIFQVRKVDAAKILINRGAKPNLTTEKGETLLHIACSTLQVLDGEKARDRINLIDYYLGCGVDPDIKAKDWSCNFFNEPPKTALELISGYGNDKFTSTIKDLIEKHRTTLTWSNEF